MYFIVLIYEIVWIGFLYCYLSQEQIMNENKNEDEHSQNSTLDVTSDINELDNYSNEIKAEMSESNNNRKNDKKSS